MRGKHIDLSTNKSCLPYFSISTLLKFWGGWWAANRMGFLLPSLQILHRPSSILVRSWGEGWRDLAPNVLISTVGNLGWKWLKWFCIIMGLQWTETPSQCPCYAGLCSSCQRFKMKRHGHLSWGACSGASTALSSTLLKWSLLSKYLSVSWAVKLEKGKVQVWRVWGVRVLLVCFWRLGLWRGVSHARPREMSKSGGEQSQREVEVRVQEASKDIYWVAEQQELEVNTKAGVLRTKGKLTKIAEFRVNGQRSRVMG